MGNVPECVRHLLTTSLSVQICEAPLVEQKAEGKSTFANSPYRKRVRESDYVLKFTVTRHKLELDDTIYIGRLKGGQADSPCQTEW